MLQNMKETKTRIIKEKAKQGCDCVIFNLSLPNETKIMHELDLINENQKKYGVIKTKRNKIILELTLPHFIRNDNVEPFSINDSIYLQSLKCDCYRQLEQLFGDKIDTKIDSIECNLNLYPHGESTVSDVLNLLVNSSLSHERDSLKYIGLRKKGDLKPETHTTISKKPHYYVVKGYNKTLEQKRKSNGNKNDSSITTPELLRIEIIMQERILKKLFGEKTTLSDILTNDNLLEVIREYKRIFCDEIIPKIKQYLTSCRKRLTESLCETESIDLTVAKERELIPDVEVLKRAIKRYQEIRGVSDNSNRDSKRYAEKYNLPKDTLITIKNFRKSCG